MPGCAALPMTARPKSGIMGKIPMLALLLILALVHLAGTVVLLNGFRKAPLAYEDETGFRLGASPEEDLPARFSWWDDGERLADAASAGLTEDAVVSMETA